MRRAWIITNPASGSTSPARCAAIAKALTDGGAAIAGRTDFPADALPDVAALEAAGADTIVLFAGDGTINAALCALADWPGDVLILPGGTMNLLARALHGPRGAEAIVATIVAQAQPQAQTKAGEPVRRTALPHVEAGPHRAFVGLILGPAAHWVRAREAVRGGRWRRLAAAARGAWQRTFGRGIRLLGAPGLAGRYQAVMVRGEGGTLRLAAIDARDWAAIATLGWGWLTGDWMAARAVTTTQADRVAVAGRRAVLALFDGEPVLLDAGTPITTGTTPPRFLTTIAD